MSRALLRRFGYIVFFRVVDDEEVDWLAVLHQRGVAQSMNAPEPKSGAAGKAAAAGRELASLFLSCGYVRRFSVAQRERLGSSEYKKGFEVRFLLRSRDEVEATRRLLETVGLRAGKPFRKHNRFVQPVYGKAALEWFLKRLPVGRERAAAGFDPNGARTRSRPRVRPAR